MRGYARLGIVGATVFLTGCQYLQFLPFLKPEVDTSPRGGSATARGPAFATAVARHAIDPSVDWGMYNNTLTGTRFSPLAQITAQNVDRLRPVCTFSVGERTPMQSGPVVVDGVMYFTTDVKTFAIDAATCQLRWEHTYAYSPKPDFNLKVNRGVAYADTPHGALLVRGSNDGRVYAIDAQTGRERWNVMAGDVKRGETFPAAPIAWRGMVYIGNAGGDNFGVTGRMMAFDAESGARVWSFDLVPRTGADAMTWPPESNATPRAGGTTWTSYAIDTVAGALYVPTGNAAPDFLKSVRPGPNLYTHSVVVLDARTGAFRAVYPLLPGDYHDWDIAAAPVLLTTQHGRAMVAEAGKDAYLYGIDRTTNTIRYKTEVSTRENATAPLTEQGTRFCPGVQGGVEWNGPAYSPVTNLVYVGATDWCTTVKLGPAKALKNQLGLPWTGSVGIKTPFGINDPPDKRRGWLTAVDVDNGEIRWRFAAPMPMVAGVTATRGGVVFAADLGGTLYGVDATTGAVRFRYATGQPIGGGIISYAVRGTQYVAVASGLHAPDTWRVESTPAKVIVLAVR